ncbi:MAG TPA: glycoside hydrolase family 2 TIM barrel-domain containing protein [Verrucomicrobiota bacterium]|nr:glycoside hydrolase family 2 TIM barrel-domain containing protein [Verrucomicrobiota bacterium]
MASATLAATGNSPSLSLRGSWRFALDPDGIGQAQEWYRRDLPDRITLPGTTDQAGKGYPLDPDRMNYAVDVLRTQWPGTQLPQRADEAGTLVRDPLFIGKAWYQRDLLIPRAWENRHLQLRIERALWRSRVWLDDRFVGTCDSLVADHRYDLGRIPSGQHRLTVCVDNDLQHNIGIIGHAYGPETQSRWNGMIGDLRLIATDPVFIRSIQAYPETTPRRAHVRVKLANPSELSFEGHLRLKIQAAPGTPPMKTLAVDRIIQTSQSESVIELDLPLPDSVRCWNEFSPALYQIQAELRGQADQSKIQHEQTIPFGLREIRRQGRHIEVNGRRVFLRGTLDCCVYPKTGHPPMTQPEWERVLGAIKSYGFNHVRFHSWCPPEAAFAVADRMGLYLGPETPFWVDDWTVETGSRPKRFGFDNDALEYVRNEIRRISDAYGNHPSFALFCIGNEFGMGSDWETVHRVLAEAKAYDPRHLQTATTARKQTPADDFWITHSTGKQSTRGVGPPHTDWDFTPATLEADLPILAHETGQRPVFPDYEDLLPKFTGPLKPLNYVRLQRLLNTSGLGRQMKDFEWASARFQGVQYRAEHEAMRRTPDLAGYQLLMLNDFTGQSEALVGILDPFFESKGVIRPSEVRQWNAPTVPLARFQRHTWSADDSLDASFEVSHFGEQDLRQASVRWELRDPDSGWKTNGQLGTFNIPAGAITSLGKIRVPLDTIKTPACIVLQISVGKISNQWRHWVYPDNIQEPDSSRVFVTRHYDDAARAKLAQGEAVLLLGSRLKTARSAPAGFASVYWSAGWWGHAFSSLGLLCRPDHPALAGFPNPGHSDWPWHPVIQGGSLFDLTGAPAGFRPLVQAVPDFHFCRLLGYLFETRVGPGRLLVCGFNLDSKDPAARALKTSLLDYARSRDFAPAIELEATLLNQWLSEAP